MIREHTFNYQKVFDLLAPHYQMVDVFSFGMARYYRRQALQKANIKQNSNVLDLMCGIGNNAEIILQTLEINVKYTGVDFSEKMIFFAKSRYKKSTQVCFIQNNLFEPFLLVERADHIVCTYGLKCIAPLKYRDFAKKIKLLVCDDGTITFTEFQFPTPYFFRKLFKLYLNTIFRIGCLIKLKSVAPIDVLIDTISSRIDLNLLKQIFQQEGFNITIEEKCMGTIILIHGKKNI